MQNVEIWVVWGVRITQITSNVTIW